MAEGAPLLREYGAKNPIEGSNPSLSAIIKLPRLERGFLMILASKATTGSKISVRRGGRVVECGGLENR